MPRGMLFLRSLAFNVAFYANFAFWMLAGLCALPLPRRVLFVRLVHGWANSSLWLLKAIAGTGVEVRGRENIPKGGCIIVGKHQSLWETFALIPLVEDPCYILKRELMWIPVFGWLVWKGDMIAINRKAGASAMAKMNVEARRTVADGRQIMIFAEGTRRPVGAPPAYKQGFSHLYEQIGAPMVPVALNSGLYWPRRKFLRRPGTILVEVLPAIPPGLPRTQAFERARDGIEEASNRLLAEAGWTPRAPAQKG